MRDTSLMSSHATVKIRLKTDSTLSILSVPNDILKLCIGNIPS